jgi:hypothetical protein
MGGAIAKTGDGCSRHAPCREKVDSQKRKTTAIQAESGGGWNIMNTALIKEIGLVLICGIAGGLLAWFISEHARGDWDPGITERRAGSAGRERSCMRDDAPVEEAGGQLFLPFSGIKIKHLAGWSVSRTCTRHPVILSGLNLCTFSPRQAGWWK